MSTSVPTLDEFSNDDLATPSRDRLVTTLFIAALLHGAVILGITFGSPEQLSGAIPTLQVMLTTDQAQNEELNPEAAYLAQRNQHGIGTTLDDIRPTSPPSSLLQAEQLGIADGNGAEWRQATSGATTVDLVATPSNHSNLQVKQGVTEPSHSSESPLALMYTPPAPVLATNVDRNLNLRGKFVQEMEFSPDTREARLAPYLDSWRRKVERLGTVKYPMAARRESATANPVLEVVIRADGKLQKILVRRSSGSKALDEAAIGILKLAAPFDAFPPALKQEYDQLRFAYEWQFVGSKLSGTVRVAE
jgi:periplasmic protein TonB